MGLGGPLSFTLLRAACCMPWPAVFADTAAWAKRINDKNKAAAPVSEILGLRDDDPELAELFDGPIGSKGADAGATPSTGQQASEASEATGSDVTAAISEAQLREANDASVDGRRGLRSLRPRSRGTASSVCTPVRALCRPTPLLLIAGACACLSTCQVQGEERGLFENHGESFSAHVCVCVLAAGFCAPPVAPMPPCLCCGSGTARAYRGWPAWPFSRSAPAQTENAKSKDELRVARDKLANQAAELQQLRAQLAEHAARSTEQDEALKVGAARTAQLEETAADAAEQLAALQAVLAAEKVRARLLRVVVVFGAPLRSCVFSATQPTRVHARGAAAVVAVRCARARAVPWVSRALARRTLTGPCVPLLLRVRLGKHVTGAARHQSRAARRAGPSRARSPQEPDQKGGSDDYQHHGGVGRQD